ncbi:MAG TPA: CotH kinase family protein, partial [Candidatus Udaeobacter sp.]|nr:CotH kinase family protein [Candidatus Udaeobacter sp.]
RTSRQVSKKNWKIKFDAFVPGQEFVNGWEELNLNAQFGERTMLRNSLAWKLTGRVGVDEAESGHVALKVNGEYFGVYDSIEPIDSSWLARHNYPPGGSLYKAEVDAHFAIQPDTAAYLARYSKITNESTGIGDLIQFIELVNATPAAQTWNVLKSKFDIEGFINYLAAMTALNNDSYYDHNYYLYHDLVGDKWYWIPWDLDSTFGHEGIFETDVFNTTSPLVGQFHILIQRLLDTPHFRRRFLERTLEIANEELAPSAFNATVDSAWAFMKDEARLDWKKWGWEDPAWIDGGAVEIKATIPDRKAYIESVAPTFMPPQEIFINEFMADNDSVIADGAGDYDDWIEIVNLGIHPAILDGYFLTDDITAPTRWALPDTTIPPGAHIIFWCDNELTEGPTHTNFQLEKNGEWIGLYGPTPGAPPIDSKGFGNQIKDVSFGRFGDGNWNWTFMGTPTPGAVNLGQGNLPPAITQVDHIPASPGLNVQVTVTATIVDDGTVSSAKVLYKPVGSGYLEQTLRDDGNGGDQSAGDHIYTATLPGQPQPGVVLYYLVATDNQGREATDPVDAPIDTHAYTVAFAPPNLVVNEFLAQNTNGQQDEFGEFADWVEIWNGGQDPVSMHHLCLSDNFSNRNKYEFPDTTLAPGAFISVFCDDDAEQGPFHAAFALSANGERIGLFASQVAGNAVIDTLSFGPQTANISFGRYPDGDPSWRFLVPTYNASNQGGVGVGDQPAGAVPLRLVLGPCRPNPTRSAAHIPFGLPTRGHTRLVIYDAAGRAVAKLLDQEMDPGFHAAEWDGRAADAGGVPAGVYFYRLDFLGETRTGKLTLLR